MKNSRKPYREFVAIWQEDNSSFQVFLPIGQVDFYLSSIANMQGDFSLYNKTRDMDGSGLSIAKTGNKCRELLQGE